METVADSVAIYKLINFPRPIKKLASALILMLALQLYLLIRMPHILYSSVKKSQHYVSLRSSSSNNRQGVPTALNTSNMFDAFPDCQLQAVADRSGYLETRIRIQALLSESGSCLALATRVSVPVLQSKQIPVFLANCVSDNQFDNLKIDKLPTFAPFSHTPHGRDSSTALLLLCIKLKRSWTH